MVTRDGIPIPEHGDIIIFGPKSGEDMKWSVARWGEEKPYQVDGEWKLYPKMEDISYFNSLEDAKKNAFNRIKPMKTATDVWLHKKAGTPMTIIKEGE